MMILSRASTHTGLSFSSDVEILSKGLLTIVPLNNEKTDWQSRWISSWSFFGLVIENNCRAKEAFSPMGTIQIGRLDRTFDWRICGVNSVNVPSPPTITNACNSSGSILLFNNSL